MDEFAKMILANMSDRSFDLIRRDGYRIEKTPQGLFVMKEGEKVSTENRFYNFLPKIDRLTWLRIVWFFRTMAEHGLEAAADLFWDIDEKKYFIFVPKQYVAAARCEIEYNAQFERVASKNLLVAELHSHHFMPPVFSETDNDDEKGTRIFGVFGSYVPALDKNESDYDFTLRAGSGGMYVYLQPEDIFEDYEESKKAFLPFMCYESLLGPVHGLEEINKYWGVSVS